MYLSSTHIETEGLESMDLVVGGDPADESSGQGIAEVVVKHGKRTRTSKDVRREVGSSAVSVIPVAVCGRTVDGSVRISPVRVLRRIEEGCLSDNPAVGIIRVRDDSLCADIQAQMLVKEVRRKVDIDGSSVIT